MKAFTFSDQPNSYFEGHDLRIGRQEDGRVIVTNRRNDFWVLNVKSGWVRSMRDANVQEAANKLTDKDLERLEEQCKEFFWREAEHLAVTHGFSGTVYQEGRSGGWLAVEETKSFDALHPMQAVNKEEQASIEHWLAFCFDVEDLQEAAEKMFDDEIVKGAKEKSEQTACPNCDKTFPKDEFDNDGLLSRAHITSGCTLGNLIGVLKEREDDDQVPNPAKIAEFDIDYFWDYKVAPLCDWLATKIAGD